RKILMPARVPRVVAYAIDSAKGPEVDDHNMAAEVLELLRLGIDPLVGFLEFRSRDVHSYRLLTARPREHQHRSQQQHSRYDALHCLGLRSLWRCQHIACDNSPTNYSLFLQWP